MLIYQFIKTFLDNKMSIFEEYGSFKISEIIYLFILLLLLFFMEETNFNASSLQRFWSWGLKHEPADKNI